MKPSIIDLNHDCSLSSPCSANTCQLTALQQRLSIGITACQPDQAGEHVDRLREGRRDDVVQAGVEALGDRDTGGQRLLLLLLGLVARGLRGA